MITITLNGNVHSTLTDATIHELLAQLELTEKRIAVEVNQAIVPRSQHAVTALQPGDVVEIIHAVGGG